MFLLRAGNREILQSCSASTSQPGEKTCGVKGPVTKIVGGVTAEKYKYTWLALLGQEHFNIAHSINTKHKTLNTYNI